MYKLFGGFHGFLIFSISGRSSKSPMRVLNPRCCSSESQDPKLFRAINSFHSSKIAVGSIQTSAELNSVQENESGIQKYRHFPEWVDLMDLLVKRGYLETDGNSFSCERLEHIDANYIRTACLNFARERQGLVRFLSRKDIRTLTGCGCPSTDRKVVNSGKRLRAHVGIDEGHVCSACSLRGDCDRAYVKAHEDEYGRTVDVMRILLAHGLHFISGTMDNISCQREIVKESARRLIKEMIENSINQLDHHLPSKAPFQIDAFMKQGDWLCPKCNFHNFAKNIKCLRCCGLFEERLSKLREREGGSHLPLKKGDWICERCNFLNFAKNTQCHQCEEKPKNRHLNPGEWQCESCNYINFRRNVICLKCDHRRMKSADASLPEHNNSDFPDSRKFGLSHKRIGMNPSRGSYCKFGCMEQRDNAPAVEEMWDDAKNNTHGALDHVEAGDDDDDIAEWFSHKKNKKKLKKGTRSTSIQAVEIHKSELN